MPLLAILSLLLLGSCTLCFFSGSNDTTNLDDPQLRACLRHYKDDPAAQHACVLAARERS